MRYVRELPGSPAGRGSDCDDTDTRPHVLWLPGFRAIPAAPEKGGLKGLLPSGPTRFIGMDAASGASVRLLLGALKNNLRTGMISEGHSDGSAPLRVLDLCCAPGGKLGMLAAELPALVRQQQPSDATRKEDPASHDRAAKRTRDSTERQAATDTGATAVGPKSSSAPLLVGVDLSTERLATTRTVLGACRVGGRTAIVHTSNSDNCVCLGEDAARVQGDDPATTVTAVALFAADGCTFAACPRAVALQASASAAWIDAFKKQSSTFWRRAGELALAEGATGHKGKGAAVRVSMGKSEWVTDDHSGVVGWAAPNAGGLGGLRFGVRWREGDGSELDVVTVAPPLRYQAVLVDAECSTDGSPIHVPGRKAHLARIADRKADNVGNCHDERTAAQQPAPRHAAPSRAGLVSLQRRLLLRGLSLLLEGGVLVYCTCSADEAQNEGVVGWVLERLGDDMPAGAADVDDSSQEFKDFAAARVAAADMRTRGVRARLRAAGEDDVAGCRIAWPCRWVLDGAGARFPVGGATKGITLLLLEVVGVGEWG